VLAKSVDVHFGNSSDLIGPVTSGAVKALAVSTRQRMAQLPDVPTVAETIPDFEYVAWNGYAVAGDFPPEAVARLVAALKLIAREPDVIARFANLGIDSVGTTQEEAIASIRRDMPIYAKIVDMAGVRLK
jgi:tripartite-type tricarboxylate transporter receptor subunit TctC